MAELTVVGVRGRGEPGLCSRAVRIALGKRPGCAMLDAMRYMHGPAKFFLSALLFASTLGAAPAADRTWHLVLHVHSLHESTSDPDITDRTPGLGVMRRTSEHWLLGVGVFRNSIGRTSGYLVGGKQWELGPVRAGGLAGLTHNYRGNDGGLVPLAAGLVTVPIGDRLALEFIAIPRVRDYSYATLNLSLSRRL